MADEGTNPRFTPRQREVLELLARGYTNPQIAETLGISLDGAKWHVREILSLLNVPSREDAARYWRQRTSLRERLRLVTGRVLTSPKGIGVALASVVILGLAGGLAIVLLAVGSTGQKPSGAVPAGKLAYLDEGDLWVKTLPDGPSERLVEDIEPSPIQWSSSGAWLLADETVVKADGSVQRVAPGCASWSPIIDELVCSRPDVGLVIERADGSRSRNLGVDPAARSPIWSPHGALIAYRVLSTAAAPGRGSESLRTVHSDGSGERVLFDVAQTAEGQGVLNILGFTADSLFIIFQFNANSSASLEAGGLPLYSVRVADGQLARFDAWALTNLELFGGSAGPGPVALTTGAGRQTWAGKAVSLLDPATAGFTTLTSPTDSAFAPAWSPDGSQLAFVSAPAVQGISGGDRAKAAMAKRRIWVMNADGSGLHRLTAEGESREERPIWANDGSGILFVRFDSDDAASLWFATARDEQLTKLADVSYSPGYQPDLWFGFYGNVYWSELFAWWQPSG